MYRYLIHFLTLVCLSAVPTWAADLSSPEGDVILTVSGNVAVTNDGDIATFDLAMLMEMSATEIKTTTIWTEDEQVFVGVSLVDIVAELGLTGKTLRATAINDYAVDIPASDAVEGSAIIAYLLNGEPMSVRDKGPLWIVYPYDDDADFRTEVIYSRSIWQLDRIEAID